MVASSLRAGWILTLLFLLATLGYVPPGTAADLQQARSALIAGEVMGVAYSGFRRGQHPDRGEGAILPTREQILEDLRIMERHGFRLIRLYDAGENSRQVLELIEEHALPFKVLLGAWLKAEISNHEGCPWLTEPIAEQILSANRTANDLEIERVIALATRHHRSVVAINVGNEALIDWTDHLVSVERVVELLDRVRAPLDQPVTVAENYVWWAREGQRLLGHVDFVGVHSYPLWENQTIETALAFTLENLSDVREALPDLPIAILEAGWPTSSVEFPKQAGEENQARYFNELLAWAQGSNTSVLFFEAFDEPWKGDPLKPDGAEKHWGLFFEDRSAKVVTLPGRWDDAGLVVWALNIGGGAHRDVNGVDFLADPGDIAGRKRRVENTRAAQDAVVYSSLREGEISLERALPQGVYSVTLLFAEPDDRPIGSRRFDVIMENQLRMENVDVRLYRDGNHRAAWKHTVPDVTVADGKLNIRLRSVVGEPLLSGIIVRETRRDARRWRLLWADEFDGEGAPDPALWTLEDWEPGRVNGEDQAYTSRPRNVRVENGHLLIEAHREDDNEAKYTSARLHTQGKARLHYGRIDVRARLPRGQGTWSAIWMMPEDSFRYATTCGPGAPVHGSEACDAWPNSGELDIAEHVGYNPTHLHGTVHTREYFFINQQQRKASIEAQDVSDDFHLYSLEWSPRDIHLYYDGKRYFSYQNDGTGWRSWPFDHPFYLLLNLAIGGDWGRAGGPIDPAIFPTRMEVDYVRAFAPVSDGN